MFEFQWSQPQGQRSLGVWFISASTRKLRGSTGSCQYCYHCYVLRGVLQSKFSGLVRYVSALTFNRSSFSFLPFIWFIVVRQTWGYRRGYGVEMECTLDRLPVYCRVDPHNQLTVTLKPAANLESPFNLTWMFLDCGGRLEYPERAHADTEKAPGGQWIQI